MTVVIVHNPELEKGQMQGVLKDIEATNAKLFALQQKLHRRASGETVKGKNPTEEHVVNTIDKILSVEYMMDIFEYVLLKKGNNFRLEFRHSEERLEIVRATHLGKTILFTDRGDFTNEQIVAAYRNAWHIESSFKQMKDPKHVSVSPIYHWTDEKIRVHIFICVLAYRLCSLLLKELADRGIIVSINKLIDYLSSIRRVNTFFGDVNKPKNAISFTEGNDLATQVEEIYQLKSKYGI